ncbi:MAG: four helix bundle protein [Thermoplasmatales archaeon]|nr:four helix bundle protein [Thermoplasmatales archaeon]
MDKIKGFKELGVWQKGHKLVLDIYDVTQKFPKDEKKEIGKMLNGLIKSLNGKKKPALTPYTLNLKPYRGCSNG